MQSFVYLSLADRNHYNLDMRLACQIFMLHIPGGQKLKCLGVAPSTADAPDLTAVKKLQHYLGRDSGQKGKSKRCFYNQLSGSKILPPCVAEC